MQNSFLAERGLTGMRMDEVNVLPNENRPEVGQKSKKKKRLGNVAEEAIGTKGREYTFGEGRS